MTVPIEWRKPAFHPTYARLLCMLLRARGVDTQLLLSGTSLSWAGLLKGNDFISFLQMRELILAAVRLSGSPSFAMDFATATQASAHGQVGYAAIASQDVAQALNLIARYAPLRQRVVDFHLSERDGRCRLSLRERFDMGDVRIPVLEAMLVTMVQLIEALAGYALEGAEYLLPYAAPPWAGHYPSRLNGKLVFNAACMEIRFPGALLAAPCPTADPVARACAVRDCEQGMARILPQDDVLRQVRERLQGRGRTYPSAETMAAELNMSVRTLIRKLKQKGASYQALLDENRKELALWYLQNTNCPVDAIAERLGYLDTSNFSRTFRRWFAVSPSTYRRLALDAGRSQPSDLPAGGQIERPGQAG